MKDLGYGKGYKYDHAEADAVSAQTYLPDRLEGESFYEPGRFGFEKTIAERLEWWAKRRGTAAKPEGSSFRSPISSRTSPVLPTIRPAMLMVSRVWSSISPAAPFYW